MRKFIGFVHALTRSPSLLPFLCSSCCLSSFSSNAVGGGEHPSVPYSVVCKLHECFISPQQWPTVPRFCNHSGCCMITEDGVVTVHKLQRIFFKHSSFSRFNLYLTFGVHGEYFLRIYLLAKNTCTQKAILLCMLSVLVKTECTRLTIPNGGCESVLILNKVLVRWSVVQ